MALVPEIYSTTSTYPEAEKFGLSSQTRRAAVSVPSNIAEGWARPHRKEYANFIGIALGSIAELQTLLQLGHMLGYIDEDRTFRFNETTDRLRAKLINLSGSLRTN